MEAVATAAAAREPDEGEVLASWRRREGGAAESLESDSPWARRRTPYKGTQQPSCLPAHFATLWRSIPLLLRTAVLYPVSSPEIKPLQVPGQPLPRARLTLGSPETCSLSRLSLSHPCFSVTPPCMHLTLPLPKADLPPDPRKLCLVQIYSSPIHSSPHSHSPFPKDHSAIGVLESLIRFCAPSISLLCNFSLFISPDAFPSVSKTLSF